MTDSSINKNENIWRGRFAPTPSGSLHFGSLVAAVGSYLIAKSQKGEWLLRIEDLDPPREVPGAAKKIIKTLEAFGFEWDGEITYQSQREAIYIEALEKLKSKNLVYPCTCSRKQIQKRNDGIYDGYCRSFDQEAGDFAYRVKFSDQYTYFKDEILGDCIFDKPEDVQDFVIKRRDGLFAYQLAVVVDDIEQGVNHVVRGADILDSTPRQNFLYDCLGHPKPIYYHLPLVLNETGQKFSKSKFSASIAKRDASQWLYESLVHLGQQTHKDILRMSPREILEWAINNWNVKSVGHLPKVYNVI